MPLVRYRHDFQIDEAIDAATGGSLTSPVAVADGGTGATDAATARTNLGLAIGTDVQAYDADLATWAGLTPSANAQSLVTAANYAAMRALLDLEAGTDFYSKAAADAAFQPLDGDLTSIAALTTTAYGRGLLELADETALEATLDTLPNLTSIQGRTVTLADAGANAIFGWDDTAGAYENLTAAEATAVINAFVGDSGSGGTKGAVPAPASGDSTKFLKGDGTWGAIPGGGDALKADPLSQFAATTSLQLKGVISDETGSGALVFADTPTLVAPILGTPTSGTLTNCTGLPVAGITASTSTALGVGSLELGHASDTTVSRLGAGRAAVEGNLITATKIFRLNANLAGANVNTVQKIFGVGCTLDASTVYAFRMEFTLTKSAGITSHRVGIGYGGTATLNNFFATYVHNQTAIAPATVSATVNWTTNSAANANLTGNITTASTHFRFRIAGTVSINASGTFIPQYTLSAAPGGAYSTVLGSYIEIWPIGAAGADVNVGTWA